MRFDLCIEIWCLLVFLDVHVTLLLALLFLSSYMHMYIQFNGNIHV